MSNFLESFFLEVAVLVFLAIFYLIIRYALLQRPITYAEFEKSFFSITCAVLLVFIYLWR